MINKKFVRLGLIGYGNRAAQLGQIWAQDESDRCAIVAVADNRPKRLEIAREKHGSDIFTTTDYRELTKRSDVDAVAVLSPDFMHEQQAVAVLRAGKDLFCEKPLSISVESCDKILTEWQKSKRKFMMGFNLRYGNIYRVMKDMVDRKMIGDVKAAWVRHFVGTGSSKKECDKLITAESITRF